MSLLSINNALNILGIHSSLNPDTLSKAHQSAANQAGFLPAPVAQPLIALFDQAYATLQNLARSNTVGAAPDPDYQLRLLKALEWIAVSPLRFELCGVWLWVRGEQGQSAIFESDLRALGFLWSSKKACWFLNPRTNKPKADHYEPWDFERIRSTYAQRAA